MRDEHAAVRKGYDTEGSEEMSMTVPHKQQHMDGEGHISHKNLMSQYRAKKHSDQLNPIKTDGPMRDSLVGYIRNSVQEAREMATENSRENRNLLIASLSSLLIIQTLFLMAETIIPVYV
jgi:hypothetical protein